MCKVYKIGLTSKIAHWVSSSGWVPGLAASMNIVDLLDVSAWFTLGTILGTRESTQWVSQDVHFIEKKNEEKKGLTSKTCVTSYNRNDDNYYPI